MNRNKLVMFWSRKEQDFLIRYPKSEDGHLLHALLNAKRQVPVDSQSGGLQIDYAPSLVEELAARGYDITTLRFEVTMEPKKESEG